MKVPWRFARTVDTHLGGRREFALFAGSTVLYQASRFAFSVGAARSLAPDGFTIWTLVIAFLVYAPSLSLGVMNGGGRQLPLLMGQGLHEDAHRVVAASWGAAWMAGMAVVGLAFGMSFLPGAPGIALVAGLLGAGAIIYATQQMILRSTLRFTLASVQQAVFGSLALIATLVIGLLGKADLLFVGVSYLVVLWATVLSAMLYDRPPMPSLELVTLKSLTVVGFPIMLTGLFFSVFLTLDRWIAAAILGVEGAAPYAFASLVSTALLVIPTVVSQQTYPRMALALGTGASTGRLRSIARDQGMLGATLTTPIALAIIMLAAFVLPSALPAYSASSPAIIVLCVGLVMLTSLTGYGNYLNVVGGQWRYLAVQILGVCAVVPLVWLFGVRYGVTGIAIGMLLSQAFYGILLRAVAIRTAVGVRLRD